MSEHGKWEPSEWAVCAVTNAHSHEHQINECPWDVKRRTEALLLDAAVTRAVKVMRGQSDDARDVRILRDREDVLAKEIASLRARLAEAERERDGQRALAAALNTSATEALSGLRDERDEALVSFARVESERDTLRADLARVEESCRELALVADAVRSQWQDVCRMADGYEVERDAALKRAEEAERERDDWRARRAAADSEIHALRQDLSVADVRREQAESRAAFSEQREKVLREALLAARQVLDDRSGMQKRATRGTNTYDMGVSDGVFLAGVAFRDAIRVAIPLLDGAGPTNTKETDR